MDNGQTDKVLPPYVAYKSLTNHLDAMKENGIPGQLDATSMRLMSGATMNQLRQAYRYFGLIDENFKPTNQLQVLVKAERTQRKEMLRDIIIFSYPFIFGEAAGDFNLETATERQLIEKLQSTGAKGDTIRKCKAFLINACADIGISVSKYITKPRLRSERKKRNGRVSKPPAGNTPPPANNNGQYPPPPPDTPPVGGEKPHSQTELWLSKLPDFNPEWSDEIQAKWFDMMSRVLDSDKGGKNEAVEG